MWLLLLGLCLGAPAQAGEAANVAADPALEARVNRLGAELRCLVCQNQTIADSHADLAVDLKNQVREQLKAGRSEQQVIDYMTERYGDFVLYRPPVKSTTWLLWAGPVVLLVLGLVALARTLRKRQRLVAEASVSGPDADAAARAHALLDGTADTTKDDR